VHICILVCWVVAPHQQADGYQTAQCCNPEDHHTDIFQSFSPLTVNG